MRFSGLTGRFMRNSIYRKIDVPDHGYDRCLDGYEMLSQSKRHCLACRSSIGRSATFSMEKMREREEPAGNAEEQYRASEAECEEIRMCQYERLVSIRRRNRRK